MNIWAIRYGSSNSVKEATPTPEFKEAMKEMQAEIPSDKNYKFKEKNVTLVRNIFIVFMVWFSILLLWWDLVIPYAAIKAIYWTKDDMVVCEGDSCGESCQSVTDLEYDEDCLPGDRIYGDTPIWFNTNFRHEFGHLWTAVVSLHVVAAYLIFPSYLTQILVTIPGRKFHKLCGIFVLLLGVILWTFGGIAAPILVASRGLHPCAYVIENYNNVNKWSLSMASSFNLGLYLQFSYDGPLFNECLIIGISARLLVAMAFDPKYNYILRPTSILRGWYSKFWRFMTISSLWLYATRTIYAIAIVVVYYWSKEPRPVLNSWKIQTANLDETQFCIDGDDISDCSGGNNTLSAFTETVTVSESMCISSGDQSDVSYKMGFNQETDLLMWMVVAILEGLIIPLVQLPNLKAANSLRALLRLKREIKTWTDKEAIKTEITNVMAWCAMLHGYNLTSAAWVVFWTFIGNVLFSLGIGGAIPYLGGLLFFMLWWFCRCRCVTPCPEPYKSCCGAADSDCCHKKIWCGQNSCAEMFVCCIPSNVSERSHDQATTGGILDDLDTTMDFRKKKTVNANAEVRDLQMAVVEDEDGRADHKESVSGKQITS